MIVIPVLNMYWEDDWGREEGEAEGEDLER